MNRSNTFCKTRFTDKFDEVNYEDENVRVPGNNNSSDKEIDRDVADLVSGKDFCDECFIQKQPTRGVLRK